MLEPSQHTLWQEYLICHAIQHTLWQAHCIRQRESKWAKHILFQEQLTLGRKFGNSKIPSRPHHLWLRLHYFIRQWFCHCWNIVLCTSHCLWRYCVGLCSFMHYFESFLVHAREPPYSNSAVNDCVVVAVDECTK